MIYLNLDYEGVHLSLIKITLFRITVEKRGPIKPGSQKQKQKSLSLFHHVYLCKKKPGYHTYNHDRATPLTSLGLHPLFLKPTSFSDLFMLFVNSL